MPKITVRTVSFFMILVILASIGIAFADSGVNATPEVQGISTATSSDVVGTVTETDSGAWSLTYDPPVTTPGVEFDTFNGLGPGNIVIDPTSVFLPAVTSELQAQGGSIETLPIFYPTFYTIPQIIVPGSILNQMLPTYPQVPFGLSTYQSLGNYVATGDPLTYSPPVVTGTPGTFIEQGLHSGALDPGQVQYTTGYNDQYSGVSGAQIYSKTVTLSTVNTVADQSNVKANTNIQYVAQGTGRATRTEDLLIDGAGNATATAGSILCPYAQSVSTITPPFCNIAEVGSSMDTTLTSTVTSANTRFVGTDSTYPVVLNYNINAQGIPIANQSSPMIGSVSSYLKVHVQESRNTTPIKSEDLAYSESSSASGLINHFGKSMSYQSGFNLI